MHRFRAIQLLVYS